MKKESASVLLKRMSSIKQMERGKICRMSGRAHYNHQRWENGRNVVRYVPADQVAPLQEAIDGYRLYMKLAHLYAKQVITHSRKQLCRSAAASKLSRQKK